MTGFTSSHTRMIIQLSSIADLVRINPWAITDSSNEVEWNFNCLIPLTAGATVNVQLTIQNGTKVISIQNIGSFFSGILIS